MNNEWVNERVNDKVKHLGCKITDKVTGLLIDALLGGKWELIWIF